MKYLITNADDFGLTVGVNRAIIEGINYGTISSTTLMVNMPLAGGAIKWVKDNNIGCVGIHLNLTCGKPVLPPHEVPSLVDGNGMFYHRRPEMMAHATREDIEKELRAQVEKFLDAGLKPTHIDGHHHIQLHEEILEIFIDICRGYKIPMRHPDDRIKDILKERQVKTTDHFTLRFYGENATMDTMKEIVGGSWDGVMEIMLHPGYNDSDLESISSYNKFRENELRVLLSEEFKDILADNNVELVSYEFLK
ncbi:carbohydrate deacetylase [Calorimonas adulescens]|uniref:Carbohydrate deacetylase n=1 Tax=Calorimonas adulescens TaxID=2606906 RepID=A0A5D8QEP3_9THEO|nr:carbohydrate deacetylase [Calorimonas adulescens]TZE82971.1 carbohydrate deacetylase [Calorimonas adulescens]